MLHIRPDLKINGNVGKAVYEIVRENILECILVPGQRMSEKDIADFFSVSRVPVREAFIKLASEGLLDIRPQRGTYVSYIDLDHVEEIRFIRECLECAVGRIAMDLVNDSFLRSLEENLEKQKLQLKDRQFREFVKTDDQFHYALFELCGKQGTWEIVSFVDTNYQRLRLLCLMDDQDPGILVSQHMDMYNALKDKNIDALERAIKSNVRKIIQDTEYLHNKYPDYFEPRAIRLNK